MSDDAPAWAAFRASVADIAPARQMAAVNAWANGFRHVEDWDNWDVPDYWETPLELFARGGDCEDFALAKYLTLRRLGFAEDRLRVVVVWDLDLKAFHAVLLAQERGTVWLLDDQIREVVPASTVTRYRPVFAVNAQGWWDYGALTVSRN